MNTIMPICVIFIAFGAAMRLNYLPSERRGYQQKQGLPTKWRAEDNQRYSERWLHKDNLAFPCTRVNAIIRQHQMYAY